MGKKRNATASSAGKKLPAACIMPNLLYLGPVSATANTEYLQKEDITHILSIGKSPLDPSDNIQYERLGLIDAESADISPTVERACTFIDSVASSKGRVLVHCSAAISRSPTIVAAYLMKRYGMTLRESLKKLVDAREAVAPNPEFLRQLVEIEKELFDGNSTVVQTEIDATSKISKWL